MFRYRPFVFALLQMMIALLWIDNATAEKRFALIVGNSAYGSVGKLSNAVNDANLLAASLKKQNFDVELLTDLDRSSLGEALDRLASRTADYDVAAFYYAGHGIQFEGKNFLIPTDAKLKSQTSIERETISLQSFLTVLEKFPIGLVFLDACRNNPFAEQLQAQSNSRNRSVVGRGLAAVHTRGDLLVTFATLPNTVASDGASDNSPFARALVRHIDTPDIEVSVMMKRVTRDVMAETSGEQRPQQLSQMQAEFYFRREGNALVAESADEKTLLAVYPNNVSTGDEISVLADVPNSCSPQFFNLTPDSRVQPIPARFFKKINLGRNQTRFEISPGSRFGLKVLKEDKRGLNRIGFFCGPKTDLDRAQKQTLLKAIASRFGRGQLSGLLKSQISDPVLYHFSEYQIQ